LETILSWSAGKDSTATGILAKLHNIHIDEIVCVMPDPFKQELEFIARFEDYMEMPVTLIPSPTYEDYFWKKKVRGKHQGTIYGFPFAAYRTCARIMKWQPMKNYVKNRNVKFLIGIATDEKNRKIISPNESLLIRYWLTEADARQLCADHDLLNPLYKYFDRLGCVRCTKTKQESDAQSKRIRTRKVPVDNRP